MQPNEEHYNAKILDVDFYPEIINGGTHGQWKNGDASVGWNF